MTDITDTVERYLDAFNETDAAVRREQVDAIYADGARYVDPNVEAVGAEAIDAYLAAAQAQLPGFRFSLGGAVDAHHGLARFQWHAAPAGAHEPVVVGFDVIEVDAAGRIGTVHGFIDHAPGM